MGSDETLSILSEMRPRRDVETVSRPRRGVRDHISGVMLSLVTATVISIKALCDSAVCFNLEVIRATLGEMEKLN